MGYEKLKRSKMLKALAAKLKELEKAKGGWGYHDLKARRLLDFIEEEGMLPPPRHEMFPYLFLKSDSYLNNESPKWEPEED